MYAGATRDGMLLNGWIRDGALYVSEEEIALDAIRSQRTGQMIHRNRVRKAKARGKYRTLTRVTGKGESF